MKLERKASRSAYQHDPVPKLKPANKLVHPNSQHTQELGKRESKKINGAAALILLKKGGFCFSSLKISLPLQYLQEEIGIAAPSILFFSRSRRQWDTCHRLHQQRHLMWRRASGGSERERRGPSTSTRRERRSGPDRRATNKDPASGR